MKTIPMTFEGYAKVADELKHRVRIDRRRLAERVRDATADDPNLAENAEFQAAIGDQESNEARIAELQEILAHAEVIDVSKLGGDTVKFGATVVLVDEDSRQMRAFQIVGQPEADPTKQRISIASPLARALIGKVKGTSVEVEVPAGTRCYKIVRVDWDDREAGLIQGEETLATSKRAPRSRSPRPTRGPVNGDRASRI
jgi:transcription elongation factor GreA